LLEDVGRGEFGRLGFQRQVHAFMPAVLAKSVIVGDNSSDDSRA
jgi:hypothetical protein